LTEEERERSNMSSKLAKELTNPNLADMLAAARSFHMRDRQQAISVMLLLTGTEGLWGQLPPRGIRTEGGDQTNFVGFIMLDE
jgi:hypothetical protein